MRISNIYLGRDIEHESRLRGAIRKDLGRLHVLAQRVSWAVLMGTERTGDDIDELVASLLRTYEGEPAAHVAVAVARAAQGRADEARLHVERARAAISPDHPFVGVVPKDSDFSAPPPAGDIAEELPGRAYRVVAAKALPGIPYANTGVATFLRMRSGELVCINPVAMSDELGERIRALGDVTHIIAPAKYHSEQVPRAQELFPGARTWGVPGHKGYPGVAHIRFDGYLDDDQPLFPDEIDQVTMRGLDMGDVWLIDRASSTLLITDAVFFTGTRSPFSAFYAWAWGIHERPGIPSYQPVMWQDIRAYQASIRRALSYEFDNVGSNHGELAAISGNGKQELAKVLDWVLALDRLGALRLLGDFVWRHPGVFYRLVKEQVAARRK